MNTVSLAQNLAVLSEVTVHHLGKLEIVVPAPLQRRNREADHKKWSELVRAECCTDPAK